jgi:hypothetical protein
MDCFIIGKNRALRFLEQINRSVLPGVYDWFVGDGDVLHVFFHVNGVRYLYREDISTGEMDAVIKMSLSTSNEIKGLLSVVEDPEPVYEEVTPEEIKRIWRVD